jgi:glycerate-2-kinase
MRLLEDAKEIYLETLKTCDIRSLIKSRLKLIDDSLYVDTDYYSLSDFDSILLIGIGKASTEMSRAVESILVDRIKDGLIVTNHFPRRKIRTKVMVAGHPIPNQNSVIAAQKILEIINQCPENALLIFLISGGGSALIELPASPITLKDWQILNRVLVNSGASIFEINQVRKYLSEIKGGKLYEKIGSRTCLAIYLSDVSSGDLSTIASGPLIPETIDQKTITKLLDKYSLSDKLPTSVLQVIYGKMDNANRELNPFKSSIKHLLLADNQLAVDTAAHLAGMKGYKVEVNTELNEGDYRIIADKLINYVLKIKEKYPNDKVCLISGGEVNCSVKGQGIGGRNQEFVLYSASKLANLRLGFEVGILSAGTDGIDGNSIASGAALLLYAMNKKGQAYLADNDSFTLIKDLGGLTILGPSENNIRDLRIHLAG